MDVHRLHQLVTGSEQETADSLKFLESALTSLLEETRSLALKLEAADQCMDIDSTPERLSDKATGNGMVNNIVPIPRQLMAKPGK